MDRHVNPLAETTDNYSMYGRHALRKSAPARRRDSTGREKRSIAESGDPYSRSIEAKSTKITRGQGFMSDAHYSTDDGNYQLIGKDGETEVERRERMVLELFADKTIDTRKHFIDDARYRWLYHWFGFERDDEIVCKAAHRAINRCPTASAIPGDVAVEAQDVRRKWGAELRDKLWMHPAFHPFADTPKAGSILKAMFQEAYMEEVPENVPVQVILRLSSTVPGVLTGTWAASPMKMTQSRFYVGSEGKYWANVEGVPTPFELEDVLAYQPFKGS